MGIFEPILRLLGSQWRDASAGIPSQRHFRELAENCGDLICRIGAEGSAKYFSPASLLLFGWTPDEMQAMARGDFFCPEDLAILDASKAKLLSGESATELCRVRVRRKSGETVWVETKTRLARDSGATSPGDMIVVVREISARKKLEDELAALALTDGLTGLANRRAFDAALDHAWREVSPRTGPMSLLLLDIDHFKRFNDHFGHQVGDDCLRAVAAAAQATVRVPGATVARYGGEEFAMILPRTDAPAALRMGDAILGAVRALNLPHPETSVAAAVLTVSVGVATIASAGSTATLPAGLLQAADAALYRAKDKGRNRVEQAVRPRACPA